MKKVLLFILICLTILSGCSGTKDVSQKESNGGAENSVMQLMLQAETKADIMVISLPSDIKNRVDSITAKMKESVQKNSEWYLDYIKKSKEGEALPYHENFGVSEQEYNEVLNSGNLMKLIKKDEGTISFNKIGEQTYKIKTSGGIKLLDGMVIDLSNNKIQTEFGECSYGSKVVASDEQKITGRWNGHTWSYQEDNFFVNVSIGKYENENKAIIYIKIKGIRDNKAVNNEEFIQYSL